MEDVDGRLTARFLAGDPKVLRAFDDWLAKAAAPFRRRLGGDWDDVLQDLRLEVTRLLQEGRFRGESSFGTFVWRVVANRCLNHIRNTGRWHFTELEEAVVPAPRGKTRGFAEGQALKDLLLRVMEAMPEECRKLWSMLVEGFSYGEMAEEWGVREGTLRVRVRRCRVRAIARRDELLAESGGAEL
jgi:RNA polymerase sigma-70 factor (ECF subfamily)